MKLPNIVAFVGNIGAGKDFACDYLRDIYGFLKMGWSDPLYETLMVLDPPIWLPNQNRYVPLSVVLEAHYMDEAKRAFPEIRRWLRLLGTERGREVHGEDCWVRYMDKERRRVRKIEKFANAGTALRDTRHMNEVEYIRAQGGVIVHVLNDRSTPSAPSEHDSERLDYAKVADYTVQNQTTKEDYRRHLEALMAEIEGDWAIPATKNKVTI